jgi:hypothetical protein
MQEILHHKWEIGGVRVNSSTKTFRGTKGASPIYRPGFDYKKFRYWKTPLS